MHKKANIYRMANETIVEFIKLYRSCECLWNVSSEDYGSRLSRNTAYNMISRKMRLPGFGPREVARKIKSLRSAYHQEVQRIENSEQDHGIMGSAYRSRLIWFDLLDDFLRNPEKPRQFDRQSDNQTEWPEKALSIGEGETNVINSSKKLSLYESSSSEESSRRSRKRRRSSIDYAYHTAEEGERKKEKKETVTNEIEEYESFGKYIASSLSRMPFEYAVAAESELHRVIIKYRVYAMRKIVFPRTKTSRTEVRGGTTRHSLSTYLPPPNFSFAMRQRTEETRPSSFDSIGHASN